MFGRGGFGVTPSKSNNPLSKTENFLTFKYKNNDKNILSMVSGGMKP